MAYVYCVGYFETVPFWQFLLPVKIELLNKDMAIFEDYDIYAMARLKRLVAALQHMHVSVTVRSLAHEDIYDFRK